MPAKILFRSILFTTLLFVISIFSVPTIFAADPTLTLTPSTTTVYAGQTFAVDLVLDARSNNHSSSSFSVTFDPAALQLQSISRGPLYYNTVSDSIDNTTGTGTATYNFFGGSLGSSGTVATFYFKALSAATGSLSFSGSSTITDAFGSPFAAPTFTNSSYVVQAPLSDSILTLSSAYSNWSLGDTQVVGVAVNTQGNAIAGVDLVLTFDPSVLQIANTEWTGLLSNQQGLTYDNTAGTLRVSGVVNQGSPYNGQGVFLNIRFRAAGLGSSAIDFNWTNGITTDTNIVSYTQTNTDLLLSDPSALSVSVSGGSTLSFSFGLLDFVGNITSKVGTLTIKGPNVISSWSNPSSLGVITNHPLGTFAYDLPYDVVITVPGYLKKKQNDTLKTGSNPATGVMAFGNLTPGDTNGDGVNNSFDLSGVFGQWNSSGSSTADFNGDGAVNTFDVAILYTYFNNTDTI
ncbi:hypothetical protein KA078_01660 [Candidatus Woesebacteria bacterium]|nr:hypothetical protein [Candidatus Woesebacteria bacterium]